MTASGLFRGNRHDERTALRVQPEQPFSLQPQERFAHRSARHAQRSCDLALAEQFPARKGSGQYLALHVVVRAVLGRPSATTGRLGRHHPPYLQLSRIPHVYITVHQREPLLVGAAVTDLAIAVTEIQDKL